MTSTTRPLLMIPGPVEISPAVRAAHDGPPPGHQSPALIEAFGSALERMRAVWQAPASAQPFIVAGSGTLAMEVAGANLLAPGERALVVVTGYFSSRMAEILRRHRAEVATVEAAPGHAVPLAEVEAALDRERPKAVFVTHVDTSTGVRMDAQAVARLARARGALTVVDGVCSTGGEALSMTDGDVDVHLTGSQKALGLPPGLALCVVSERALAARAARPEPPPLFLDLEAWLPVMRAYERRERAYFATPATSLVRAAAVALEEILSDRFEDRAGVEARVARQAHVACAFEAAWRVLGLRSLVDAPEDRAFTLSALRYPAGLGPELVDRVAAQGVVVAGGLHPALRTQYFRVGHMGWCITQPELLVRTVTAIGEALRASGQDVDVAAAGEALRATLGT